MVINRKRPSISSNYKIQIKTQGGDENTDLAVFKSLFCFIFTYKKDLRKTEIMSYHFTPIRLARRQPILSADTDTECIVKKKELS